MMQMTEAEKSTTSKWTRPIGEALFSDTSMSRLRSRNEIRATWSKLTAEQQNQVKHDCNTMETASAGAGSGTTITGTTGSGTSTNTMASTDGTSTDTTTGSSASATTSGETTGSTMAGSTGGTAGTSDSGGSTMTIAQLRSMVKSM
ncbi:hypothetical protein PYH37_000565 [Sinorhizobium numidicum]|uniref:Uncharacterized protein n=1 Tax=Sinorhizobium numidicum TaxID=680248 RepID=A0ABY8CRA8_9HYPH|nr:hypothetical protein [Sinorhizobium numidicum]WEX75193.1 hypothetical protein PYH37_000565 [Sinorhizobium numidicum]WEX81186.1 hypothetical protein PYH38_000567 [Sinorhizobium numidicum]